jgi:hypothetical protein
MKILRMSAITAVIILVMATGCKHTPAPVKNADGTLTNPDGSVTVPAAQAAQGRVNSDGSITNPDGSVTYPANSPVAEREKQQLQPNGPPPAPGAGPVVAGSSPSTQAENAPATNPPPPVRVSAPAGSSLLVRINERLSSRDDDVGTRFTGVLERPLVSHGEVVFERGTPVAGEVVASKGKGRFKGAGDLGIELTAIGREPVKTSEYEKVDKGEGKRTGAFIGGGGGLGALIGGIAGGGKGALIGGLAGAGAGTAGAATGRRDVVIPSESVIRFRLRSSVTRG